MAGRFGCIIALDKKEKETFRKSPERTTGSIKTIWVFEDNAFVQKPIELGITDNAFFEIVSGISDEDNVIIDIEEPDAMKEMYKQFFGGGLGGMLLRHAIPALVPGDLEITPAVHHPDEDAVGRVEHVNQSPSTHAPVSAGTRRTRPRSHRGRQRPAPQRAG